MTDNNESTPIQYTEGTAPFMGMDVMVDPRVFIPRPETELLVQVAVNFCHKKGKKDLLIVDVCTGSGVVPLGIANRIAECRVIGVDISEDALQVARKNMKRFGCEDKVKLVRSDMFAAFSPGSEGVFDVIIANPPYVSEKDYNKLDAWVKAEPRVALYGGLDGMDYLDVLAGEGGRYLRPGGFIAVEVGYDQAEKVKSGFLAKGFRDVESFKDFNGYERVIVGWKHG